MALTHINDTAIPNMKRPIRIAIGEEENIPTLPNIAYITSAAMSGVLDLMRSEIMPAIGEKMATARAGIVSIRGIIHSNLASPPMADFISGRAGEIAPWDATVIKLRKSIDSVVIEFIDYPWRGPPCFHLELF